jgi:hypothetical protein
MGYEEQRRFELGRLDEAAAERDLRIDAVRHEAYEAALKFLDQWSFLKRKQRDAIAAYVSDSISELVP